MTTTQDTITVTIDGKEVACRPGELLIEVAKRAGVYIPYFCYHPRMDPVGACRMCLVNIQPGPPKPQTSCTTRVSDGMVVETQFVNKEVQQAQQGVLEFLLINHPLDCPICDRAGECPLQDQTQDYGPAETRFVEPKRRFEKAVPISPLITLDRERCILCYRCTRFCEELSGDTLIGVMERGADAYIFPFEGEAFDSYFSGNTVQICPVGALTSTAYRFKARPWDIHAVDSTCNMCACGCSLQVGVRVQDGNVARFSGAINEATNEEWLCDKGRYGNAYVSSPERITHPYARRNGELVAVGWDEAFKELTEKLTAVLEAGKGAGMIVGESLCDEDLYVAQKLARLVLRTNNVDHRLEGGLDAGSLVAPGITYDDVLSSDLAVLAGLDAREELPILFLRLRIAATKRGLPIALVHPREVSLSEHAAYRLQPLPGTTSETGAALAAALGNPLSGAPSGDDAAMAAGLGSAEVETLASALSRAARPVILLGPQHHDASAVAAWRQVAEACGGRIAWLPRRANTYGALAAGAHPEMLPGWRSAADQDDRADVGELWGGSLPEDPGLGVKEILDRAAAGDLGLLWLVGADVITDIPASGLGRRAMEGADVVVVQEMQATPAIDHADLVLPAAAFVERDGTLTNWEGRRQPVAAATEPPGAARADYAILAEAARRLGRPIGCRTLSEVQQELDGLLEATDRGGVSGAEAPDASQPPAARENATGLRLLTYRLLYDGGSRISRTKGAVELTEEPFLEINALDAQRIGISDSDEVDVTSQHGTVRLVARVSKSIRQGAVFVPWNQGDASAQALCDFGDLTPSVNVEKA